ncbi:MAG TPA: hypothetical protein VIH82_14700 [Acidimicrobiia bacterium]|jgi:hypothetical protein
MRTFASLLVAVCVTAGLQIALAAPSGARTDKFCKAVNSLDADSFDKPTSASDAESTLRKLRKLERVADKKTKKSLTALITAYQQVAAGKDAAKVFKKVAVVRALAEVQLSTGLCFSELPDVTVPPTTRR